MGLSENEYNLDGVLKAMMSLGSQLRALDMPMPTAAGTTAGVAPPARGKRPAKARHPAPASLLRMCCRTWSFPRFLRFHATP